MIGFDHAALDPTAVAASPELRPNGTANMIVAGNRADDASAGRAGQDRPALRICSGLLAR
jgi:hypothetical protein